MSTINGHALDGHVSDISPRNLADVLPSPQSNVPADNDENWSTSVAPTSHSSLFSRIISNNELPLSDSQHNSTGYFSSVIEAVESQIRRGLPVDFGTLSALLDAISNQNGIGIDDRKFLLEKILVFLSRIPPKTPISTRVEHFLLDLLYNDLPHPPSTYACRLGPTAFSNAKVLNLKFAHREADGSNNNPLIPSLGAAHTPYARSVACSHVAPQSTLPNPAIVFDTLLRRDKDVTHPTGLSSLFFAFANLIIHSLFRTNHKDPNINDTSSYLDLSPLYGEDQDRQDLVRRRDGTGRLWNDTFADARLLAMPSSVSALLVVFNRNHNFIATRILEINEEGTYKSEPQPSEVETQDDEIFNRARLVNWELDSGTFMQAIMRDYVGSILRMIPDLSPWHLSPFDEFRNKNHQLSPRGQGNVCSVEFNLLYRWHATTSASDAKWLEAFWRKLFGKKSYDEVTPQDFVRSVGGLSPGENPKDWPIGGLQRDNNGRFDDGALANILQTATAEAANAFRARGIPAVFKVIEVLGIIQARRWGVCSLNEFRSFLGLKPYSSFQEWNPNPEISEAAERLYHTIDNLELYVGMQAEETRPSIPGSGLCSGYTMSRAILADAMALIRGDRFLTSEYTPFNLTSWGFHDAQTDDNNGSFGGVLTKLLLRTLPRHYHSSSSYAHFPLMVPSRMREFMLVKDPSLVAQYTWYRPQPLPHFRTISAFSAVRDIMSEPTRFTIPYESPMANLTNGYGFYLGPDENARSRRDKAMIESALFSNLAITEHSKFYYEVTRELIADKSLALVGITTRTVDIVAHVLNYVPVHWVSARIAGLSLKTKETPQGKYTEQELYGYLSLLFTYIFFNSDSVNTWFLERNARQAAEILLKDIKKNLEESSSLFSARGITSMLTNLVQGNSEQQNSEMFLRNLRETNSDRDIVELVYIVFGVIVNSVANWSQAMAHVINFYLDDGRRSQRDAIIALSLQPLTDENEQILVGYVGEALRLDPPITCVLRDVRTDCELQGIQLGAGEKVVVSLASASREEVRLDPDASTVNPIRPRGASSLEYVIGAHSSLHRDFSDKTMAHVLRAVYSKKNLRRAAGASGQLTRCTASVYDTPQNLYINNKGQLSRWPQSLLVQFDI